MLGKNSKWLLFVLYFTFSAAHAVTPPDEVVRITAEGVINHIESNRSILEENPEKIYEMVDQLIIHYLNDS